MGFPRNRLNSADWLEIQNAVSNSDLPNDKRQRLLDKIETAMIACEAAEKARAK